MLRNLNLSLCFWCCICLLSIGCGSQSENDAPNTSRFETVAPNEDSSAAENEPRMLTADELRTALGANENAQFQKAGRNFVIAELANSGVKTLEPLRGQPLKAINLTRTEITDLSPLAGMPLEEVMIPETEISDISPLKDSPIVTFEGTRSKVADISAFAGNTRLTRLYLEGALVKDISPLKSCPLEVLWLNGCPVEDLSVLEGKKLEELNLCDTPLQNLDTVKTMQLGTLWMRNTNVKGLGPLADHGLVSLDVEGSAVNDISALSKMTTLKRLNIARTEVTDLSSLAGLSLERLIFTPSKIENGIEVIRSMPSLQTIDTSFDGGTAKSASEFWELYDAGKFKGESS